MKIQKSEAGVVFGILLVTGLITVLICYNSNEATSIKNFAIIYLMMLLHVGFFSWLLVQFLDFQKGKLKNPRPLSKIIMLFYFLLMSAGGVDEGDEVVSTIFASILVFGIVVQIIFWLILATKKKRN